VKRHRTEIQLRWSDTDALGHLNNTSYASYAELGRLRFLQESFSAVGSLILAHLAIDFRRQVSYGMPVSVETWVERLGRTSITLRQDILAGDEVAAHARSVAVHFDYAAQRSLELSQEARVRLEPYVAPGEAVG
jgi:acyl-CoA thioester hydrolase